MAKAVDRRGRQKRQFLVALAAVSLLAFAAVGFVVGLWASALPSGQEEGMTASEALDLCASPPCAGLASGAAALQEEVLQPSVVQKETAEATAPEVRTDERTAERISRLMTEALQREFQPWRDQYLDRQRSEAQARERSLLAQRTLADANAELLGEIRLLRQQVEDLRSQQQAGQTAQSQSPTTQWHFDSIRYLDGQQLALVRRRLLLADGSVAAQAERVYLLRAGEKIGHWRIRSMDDREGRLHLQDLRTGQLSSVLTGVWWQ